jgi:hypothetical protein
VRRGFEPPPDGARMCRESVTKDLNGKPLDRPRPCKRSAADGSDYCGTHTFRRRSRAPIETRDGGICVWCGGFGRSYVCDGVVIGLCAKHGQALARAVREGH